MKTTQPEIFIFPDTAKLSQALTAHVLRVAAEAMDARQRFTLALSGGSALSLLAAGMRARPLSTPLDGSAWHIFWADERCVPQGSPERNDEVARKAWLNFMSIPNRQIHAVDGRLRPVEAARAYASDLAEVFHPAEGDWPQFDLIVLGVGADGHTASLFPGDSALEETARWVVPVLHAPKPPPERVTLTLPVINHARQVAFVVAGADKAAVLARVRAPDPLQVPVPAQRVDPGAGKLRWFVDQTAAASRDEERGP